MRIAHFFAVPACVPVTSTVTEAGASSSPAALDDEAQLVLLGASRSASCCCEAGWSGCCTCASSPEAMPAMIVIPSSNEHAANLSVAFGAARTGEPSVAFLSRTNSPERHGVARRAHERERSREAQDQADDRQHKRQKRLRGGTAGSSPRELDDAPSNEPGFVRLRAFFAGGIRIAGRLRGSHLSLTARSASPERASSRSGRSIGSSPWFPSFPSNGRVSPSGTAKGRASPRMTALSCENARHPSYPTLHSTNRKHEHESFQ